MRVETWAGLGDTVRGWGFILCSAGCHEAILSKSLTQHDITLKMMCSLETGL